MGDNILLEHLASVQHDIWAHWMRYCFSICTNTKDGGIAFSKQHVEKWRRQMSLKYEKLTEYEKDSDRKQAKRILKIL